MTIGQALHAFFTSQSGTAAYGVLVLMAADWFFGTLKSITDGTFTLTEVAAFLRKHVAGRVFPIWGLLFFGYIGNQDLLTTAGLAAAALYVAETVGSILSDWAPPAIQKRFAALTGNGNNPQPVD